MWHLFKTLVASVWVIIVVWFYYISHTHYQQIFPTMHVYLWGLATILFIYFAALFYLYHYKKRTHFSLRLSPFKIVVFFLVFFWITFNFLVQVRDLTQYQGSPLVQDQGRIFLLQSNEKLNKTSQIIIQKDQLVSDTTHIKKVLSPEIHAYFSAPSFLTIQKSFFSKFSLIFGALLLVLITVYSLGLFILKRFSHLYRNLKLTREKFLIATALGFSALMFLLFLLGLFGYLNSVVVWISIILILLIFHRQAINFFRLCFHSKEIKINLLSWTFWGFLILNILFAANFINLAIPSPIGWDSLHAYINIPHLISENGHLLSGFRAYNFELILSLGFLLFNSAAVSMSLILLGALLALITLYTFLRKFLPRDLTMLLLAFFFSLPTVFFQTSIDAKIDLPLMFFGVVGLLALFKGLPLNLKFTSLLKTSATPVTNLFKEKISRPQQFLYLAAFLFGLCFGIKYTGLFLILVFVLILAWFYFGKIGFFAFFFFAWSAIIHFNYLHLGTTAFSPSFFVILKSVFIVLAGICFVFAMIRSLPALFSRWRQFLVICFFIFIAFAPWFAYNYSTTRSFSVSALLYGKSEAIHIDYSALDLDSSQCRFTGHKEDLDRFFGYNSHLGGLYKFLVLPWILTMADANAKGIYVDFSFVFLAFLPVFLFFYRPRTWRRKRFRLLAAWTLVYWFFWWFMGNGIIWYALPGFAGLITVLGKLYLNARRTSIFCRYLWGGLLVIWFIFVIPIRLYNASLNTVLAYESGLISAEGFIQRHFPLKTAFEQALSQDPLAENEYIYDVGSFAMYHIPENHRRLLKDMTLDYFTCLNLEKDDQKTLARLKQIGFKYFFLNLQLTTLTATPEQELQQKYKEFVDFTERNMVIVYQNPKHVILKLKP